jgi:hypothetical protein
MRSWHFPVQKIKKLPTFSNADFEKKGWTIPHEKVQVHLDTSEKKSRNFKIGLWANPKKKVGISNTLVCRTEHPKRMVPEDGVFIDEDIKKMTDCSLNVVQFSRNICFIHPTVFNWQQTHSNIDPLPTSFSAMLYLPLTSYPTTKIIQQFSTFKQAIAF